MQNPRGPWASAGSLVGGVRIPKTPGLLPIPWQLKQVPGLVPDYWQAELGRSLAAGIPLSDRCGGGGEGGCWFLTELGMWSEVSHRLR